MNWEIFLGGLCGFGALAALVGTMIAADYIRVKLAIFLVVLTCILGAAFVGMLL